MEFEWDERKHILNIRKHGVTFFEAQLAFADPRRVIAEDTRHSTSKETRLFCFGQIDGRILTVRFTYRGDAVRIFGAAVLERREKTL